MIEALMIPAVIALAIALCALVGLAINAVADARSDRMNRPQPPHAHLPRPRPPRRADLADEVDEGFIEYLVRTEGRKR